MGGYAKIRLDDNAYYRGQTFFGKVECKFTEEETIRAIRIKLKGRARVEWKPSKTKFTGEDIYFDELFNLIGGYQNITISAGTHTYPFSYILPNTPLPSPLIGDYGSVKYKIKVTVDRPWISDYEDEVLLNVISPLDLNDLPGIRNPFLRSIEKTPTSCCFASGPITFSITLPFTGYVSGQPIEVGTYINNMSNINIHSVQYKILQTVEFIASSPRTSRRHSENTLVTKNAKAIGAHAEKTWTTTLVVSLAETPNLLGCSVINISYRLKVKAILPFPHSNMKISCPLTFGTVPLTEANTNTTGSSTQLNSYTTAPISEVTPFLQNVASGDGLTQPEASAPPSYEDATLKTSCS
ncbi:hypothetical protein ILUMI_06053 [Ignelater luminosus]|uniref:Arrestin C-terminal-like domain-containing protein n=1 Tax=Ignelater luminosus TaxID=2038154 RepID=A0A8K0GCZ0_IGNLU|nr:hypothetical protein ILUMI_06053 [Ignelater luminosus]